MLCFFSWDGLGAGWEAVPGKPEGERMSGCIARPLCPLLKSLLLPAGPPSSARSFACEHKTPRVSSLPGCLETGGVGADSTQAPRLVGVTLQVARALKLCLGSVCVSVCVCVGLSVAPPGAGTVPISAPCQALCHLCQVPQQRHCKPHGLRARHPHPSQGSRDWLCGAVVLVLVGLEAPQSPCPALTALPAWMLGQAAMPTGQEHTELPASPCCTKPASGVGC